MNQKEIEILAILQADPLIAQADLAERLNISRSAVANYISNMMKKGVIRGKGYILCDKDYVVVIGAANMDINCYTEHTMVYGDSNPAHFIATPGGVGRNIAQNIAMLGDKCQFISVVGDDQYGATILQMAPQFSLHVSRCSILKGQNTATCFSLLNPQGEMLIALNDMSILNQLTPQLLVEHQSLIRRSRALVIDCNLSQDSIDWIFSRNEHPAIFVDVVSRFKVSKIRPWLHKIHTLKLNIMQAELLCNLKIQSDLSNLPEITAHLHRTGVARLVITLGQHGLFFSEQGGEAAQLPAIPVTVVNATGAGDALLAGLVNGHLAGLDFRRSLEFSLGCAALTLQSEFTHYPHLTRERVSKFLQQARHNQLEPAESVYPQQEVVRAFE